MYFQATSPIANPFEAAFDSRCLDYVTFKIYKQTKSPFGRRWVFERDFLPVSDWDSIQNKPTLFATDLSHIAAGDAKTGDVIIWNGLAWTPTAPVWATVFTDLDDVPSDYTGHAGEAVVVNATEDGLEFIVSGASFITSITDTSTIDLDVTTGALSANFIGDTDDVPEGSNLYFTTPRAVTALTGQNISIFNNNVPYLTSASLSGYVPYLGATSNLNMGSFSVTANTVFASSVHAHDSLSMADLTHAFHIKFLIGETESANRVFQIKLNDADRTLTISADSTISNTNTGDQTTIVGISGTKAQFDTACSDGNFLYVGDITQYTDEMAQDAIGAMINVSLQYVDGTPLLAINDRDFGDITTTSSGTVWTIDNDAVTFAKIQNITDNRLLGRSAGSTGDMMEITVGTGLSLSAGALTCTVTSGANTALSNLASVAINTHLLWGTNGTLDLGDSTHQTRNIYIVDSGFIGWEGAINASIQAVSTDLKFSNATSYTFDNALHLSATSNQIVLQSAGITGTLSWTPATSNKTIKLPNGSTDFTATGGTSHFLKQNSVGAAITSAQVGVSDLSGLGTNVGTFLGTPSSANLAAAITDETGSGALMFATQPVFSYSTATSTSTSVTFTSANFGQCFLWSPSGTATATLPANGAAAGSWIWVFLLTNQTVTISAATADTLITVNDTAADSVAFSTTSLKIGSSVFFISNGSVWFALNMGTTTMTIAT